MAGQSGVQWHCLLGCCCSLQGSAANVCLSLLVPVCSPAGTFADKAKTVGLPFALTCASTGVATVLPHSASSSLVVVCPADCTDATLTVDTPVYTSEANKYLSASSICRAALHAGRTLGSASPFVVTLAAGSTARASWLSECRVEWLGWAVCWASPGSAGSTQDMEMLPSTCARCLPVRPAHGILHA